MYNRERLESISELLYTGPNEKPIQPQRLTDWAHYRNAMVVGMGADTLLMQQDIERLEIETCRAILVRAEDGRLIAGFKMRQVSIGVALMFTLSPPVTISC